MSVLAVLLSLFYAQHTSIVHVFWFPRQTQHLWFETSFRPEDHTDWERAPPSYDLQSWSSLGLNEHLTILYLDEPPWTTFPVRICPPHWNPYRKCRKIWTRFPSSEIPKRVGKVWELRDLKPVPLQKKAQIGNFALVTHKVSLCNARRGDPNDVLWYG